LAQEEEGASGRVIFSAGRRIENMPQLNKCEFMAQTQAKAEAKLNEWKKQNARAVSIIAQIIETHSAGSDASVIRVEYENNDKAKGRRRP
jgi:hypothetical protein